MRKSELKALKRIYATPKMMKLARENKLDEPIEYKSGRRRSTRYDMFIRCQTRGSILMVCLFFPDELAAGRKEPLYEIYINAEGNQYLTWIAPKGQTGKWSTAKLENLGYVVNQTMLNAWYYRAEEAYSRIWQNQEGKNIIQTFLRTKKKGIGGIIEWQDKARIQQIEAAEKRQQAPWDADMKLVPQPLQGYLRWTVRDAALQHYIFYDYDKNGAKTGYCSYCEKQVPVTAPKHNRKTTCSVCRKDVIMKAKSKCKTLVSPDHTTSCIQKIKGGIVIREYRTYTSYAGREVEKPYVHLSEEYRHLIFENGTTKSYTWGMYKNKKRRWIPETGIWHWGREPKLYRKNIAGIDSKVLKESAINLWHTLPCSAGKYLFVERGNPAVEKLARIGMFRLAEDLINTSYDKDLLNQDATEISKILKLDKARLSRLKNMGGNIYSLRWMQNEKQLDTIWPDDMIRDFGECEIEPRDFHFLPAAVQGHLVKLWNYLKKQSALSGKKLDGVLRTWQDYENMAKKAKWNIKAEQILFPKNLQAAHNEVIMFLRGDDMKKDAERLEKKWPKVHEILPSIQKFEYKSEKYAVVAPKSILDIVKEGTALNHCVHTCDYYFARIQKNESYLFFLRSANAIDTPWYTLEVEPSGNIRQKRTTGDNQNKDFDDALEFLKKWQQVFKSRLTKEEKELGIIADKARIEEYKKLRENGNRVWHGRLAGQLLADVLEQDFMAVI